MCACSERTGLCYERCQAAALQQECHPATCPCGDSCGNRPFSRLAATKDLPLQLFKTEGKGWGVKTTKFVEVGELVVEYVGGMHPNPHFALAPALTLARALSPIPLPPAEIIDADSWERRKRSLSRFDHMYFMALNGIYIAYSI